MKNVKWLNGSIDKKWRELSKSNVLIHFAAVGVNEKFTNLESCFNFNVIKSANLIFNAIQANCLKWMIISSSYEQKVKSLRYIHKTLKDKTRTPHFNYAFTKDLFSKISAVLVTPVKAASKSIFQDTLYDDTLFVFDGAYMSYLQIFTVMQQLQGRGNHFRIRPPMCNFILGSDQSDQKGNVLPLLQMQLQQSQKSK